MVLFCRVDLDVPVLSASCVNARRYARSRQLRLLACVVALWSARTCFAALWKANCGLLCLVCGRCSATTCSNTRKKGPQKQTLGEKAILKNNERKGKGSPACNRTRRCSVGRSEKPQTCQWSPLRKKEENRRYIPAPHMFLNSFGRYAKSTFGRSAIGAERIILIPRYLLHTRAIGLFIDLSGTSFLKVSFRVRHTTCCTAV